MNDSHGLMMNIGLYYTNLAAAQRRYEENVAAGIPEDMAKGPLLEAMNKGVSGTSVTEISASIPQDIDRLQRTESYAQEGWGVNMLIRGIGNIPGYAMTHEYAVETSRGGRGTNMRAGEFSIGNINERTEVKRTTDLTYHKVRIMKSWGADNVRRLDYYAGDPRSAEEIAARLTLRRAQNWDLYMADNRTVLNGTNCFKGIKQLIQEGTATSIHSAPNGRGHVLDLNGQNFTPENLRTIDKDVTDYFSQVKHLFVPPAVIGQTESAYASGLRFNSPMQPIVGGTAVTGFQVHGQHIGLVPERDLSPYQKDHPCGFYHTDRMNGSPAGRPTMTAVAQAEGTTDTLTYGKWDANPYGAGDDVYYVATYFDIDDRESMGVRFPATVGVQVAVAAGQEVLLTLSGAPAGSTHYRIYRGHLSKGTGLVNACWIADVACDAGGDPVTFVDHNLKRPFCGTGFALSINSPVLPWLSAGQEYYDKMIREHGFENFLPFMDINQSLANDNTIRRVVLGPTMGSFLVAQMQHVAQHVMFFTLHAPEIIAPTHNFIIENIGLN